MSNAPDTTADPYLAAAAAGLVAGVLLGELYLLVGWLGVFLGGVILIDLAITAVEELYGS